MNNKDFKYLEIFVVNENDDSYVSGYIGKNGIFEESQHPSTSKWIYSHPNEIILKAFLKDFDNFEKDFYDFVDGVLSK